MDLASSNTINIDNLEQTPDFVTGDNIGGEDLLINDSNDVVEAQCDNPPVGDSIDEIIQKNVSKNVRSLMAFFTNNNLLTEKGNQKTNIINMGEKKTYFVPPMHVEELFVSMESCRMENRTICYAERQETADQARSGIMIDFDVYQKTKDVQIQDKHFESLTRHVVKLLRESVDFRKATTEDTYNFKIFYIRKPAIVLIPPKVEGEEPKYKDGFHMLIPEIQISRGFKRYILQELIARSAIKTTFKDIILTTDPDDTLDKMSCSVPVLFVGNTRPTRPVYNLTHAWDITLFIDDTDVNKQQINVANLISGNYINPKNGETTPINLIYELSLYFSLPSLDGRPTWLKKAQLDYRVELENKIQLIVEKTAKNLINDEELNDVDNIVNILAMNNAEAGYLKQLLGVLDISYATEYKKWFAVIMAIAHTSHSFKPLAVWFSHRKPESWNENEIDRVWNEATSGKFTATPVTKHSIRHWARMSSPQTFEQIDKEYYFNVLAREAYSNEGRIEHAGVAKVLHAMIWHKFIVDVKDDSKNKYVWYEFVTPGQSMRAGEVYKWREETDPDNIHLFVGEQLPKVFKQLSDNIKERKEAAGNEGEAKYWKMVSHNFKLSSSKLGNDGFQKGVISQCKYRFRHRGFIEELDSYEDIIGVGNGILKLGVNPVLIKGFHEYKISKFTTVNYVPFDPENPQVKILLQAFRDIWIEDDVFDFSLFQSCTGLDNKEAANLLFMAIGGGQNGKSFFSKMVHNTLGNMYCASGKASLLTSPLEKGGDNNSAQMQMRDKRWFYIDEFEPCSSMNTTRVKTIVSPGMQSGRDLYEKQSNFKNRCNTVAYSNFDLTIDTTDHGTWRRIYYYKNKVKFCENPDPSNPYEKKVDTRYMDDYPNDPLFLEAMLSILVHYHSRLCAEYGGELKRVPVPTIKRETEIYRNRQDTLNRFITEMLVKTSDSAEVGLQTLSAKYIEWHGKIIKVRTGKSVTQDTDTLFENSRIAADLKLNSAGMYALIGYRIKAYQDEPLLEGEKSMRLQDERPIKNKKIIDDIPVVVEEPIIDNTFDNLMRNAPTYIQSSQVMGKTSHELITELLENI